MNHTLTFYEDEATGKREQAFGAHVYNPGVDRVLKMRENVRKAAQYLGPWCPTCGKKGERCKNRDKCIRRSILLKPGPKFVTLPQGRSYQRLSKQEVQANAYRECVKRGDSICEAVAA